MSNCNPCGKKRVGRSAIVAATVRPTPDGGVVTPPPPPPPECVGAVPTVTSFPTSGTYLEFPSFVLLFSNRVDVNIYYTIDNTEPTVNSTLYTTGILLESAAQVIKAIAVPTDGCPAGPIAEFSFLNPPLENFSFAFLCTDPAEDHTGRFPELDPPGFDPNGNFNDYQYQLLFDLSTDTEIKRAEVYQTDQHANWDSGQVWATDGYIYPYADQTISFHCYPLVIKSEPGAVQLFNSYQTTLGSYAAGSYEWRLWAQSEIPLTTDSYFTLKLFLADGRIIQKTVRSTCVPPPPPCEYPDAPGVVAVCLPAPEIEVSGTTPQLGQLYTIYRRCNSGCCSVEWDAVDTGTSDAVTGEYLFTDTDVMECCEYLYYVAVLCSPSQGYRSSPSTGVESVPCAGSVDIDADRLAICAGDSVTLSWTSENCDSVTIDNGIGVVDATGTLVVTPAVTTTYTITCNNAACGNVTSSVTVTVNAPSTAGCGCFETSGDPIAVPDSVTVSWITPSGSFSAICPNTGYKYPIGHPYAGLYARASVNYRNSNGSVSVDPNLCNIPYSRNPDAAWVVRANAGSLTWFEASLESSESPAGTYTLHYTQTPLNAPTSITVA